MNARVPAVFDEKRIDAIFAVLDQCQAPGAAVGIALHGKPVYRKGFGLASMELPVVLSPSIRMRIASMTKQFTALAFLLLCEEGSARIDDPVGKYLPELHPAARKVTMRQLMAHLSGLLDVHDIRYQFSGTAQPVSVGELLSFYHDVDVVNFQPGSSWNYNNGGYLMLSAAIERISDRALEDVMHARIFEPIGMYDTQLRRFDTDFVPNSASLHMTNRAGKFEKSFAAKEHVGEGGVISTIDDLLRWLAHMDEPFIGSPATWTAMGTPQRLINGEPTGYGLGLIADGYRGIGSISHGGGLMGCNSHMIKLPAAGLDVVILVNRQDVAGIALVDKILDACLPGVHPGGESRAPIAGGVFHSPATGRVIQLFSQHSRQMVSIDGADFPMVIDEAGVLRHVAMKSYFKQAIMLIGDRESPIGIRFAEYGDVDELVPVAPTREADSRVIVGRYRADSIHVDITISAGGRELHTTGRFGSAAYSLEPLGAGIYRARSSGSMPFGGVLIFDRDASGFRFSSARTRAVPFRRSDQP